MRPRSILITLVVAGLIAVIAVLATSGSSGYQLHAVLADADGLLTGSRVEIGGVAVGNVQSLQITPQDHALVTFTVDKQDLPIGRNASLVIRPADLLGEKYIDLSVGNRSTPMPSGATIPTSRTQEATDFDQFIDIFGPTERDRLAILVHELGVALFGRGANVAQLLAAAPPSLTDTRDLINQVDASNAQLEGLLAHAQPVLSTLDAHQRELSHFVATAAGALSATAAHARGLALTVAETPSLLSQLGSTLVALDHAGTQLRPAATGLERTAPGLTAALGAIPGFSRAAQPTLAEVRSLSPRLVSLGHQAAPVIAHLEPTLRKLQTVAVAGNPVTLSLNNGIDDLLGTLQNWARAIQYSDGASHEFRVSVQVPSAYQSALLRLILGSGAPAPARASHAHHGSHPLKSGVSHLGGTLSSTTKAAGSTLSGAVHQVVGGVTGALNGVTAKLGLNSASQHGATTSPGSGTATTATSSSLGSLLTYLMGGGK
ncbi:MAG TPA: MlaD family protein [Solirubrobacteraceae bacterium]|nr:MlaD family protein [Solirubrobacteraceae bacterium]